MVDIWEDSQGALARTAYGDNSGYIHTNEMVIAAMQDWGTLSVPDTLHPFPSSMAEGEHLN